MNQKVIGLIGGMSWESTAVYYRLLNQDVRRRLGGIHSAKIVMHSVDFAEIEELQRAGDWQTLGLRLAETGRTLQSAGADCLLICANTMHRVADAVSKSVSVPVLHVVDAAAARIRELGLKKVGLLGTRYTMEGDFYGPRLERQFGLEVLLPNSDDRDAVHDVIFQELVAGIVSERSRELYRAVMAKLVADGAECVLLACTELALLVRQEDCVVPLLDTTEIHAQAAVRFALSDAVRGAQNSAATSAAAEIAVG